jgi:phosphotransferase family enzyme
VNGDYIGRLPTDDPLYDFLVKILRDCMHLGDQVAGFRVFRLNGHEVYGYEEKGSRARIICKFYGSRFESDPGLASIVAQQESDNLQILRGYNLIGSPHHVVRPFAVRPDINCVLAVEYYSGEELTQAIRRATHHHDDAYLFRRLKALAYYLSTQHSRTSNGEDIDFGVECDYFNTVVQTLLEGGRIGRHDADEFCSLRDLWRGRPRMWQDRQVWLHGDATPGNFLFGEGLRVGAIDLERMRRGDPAFDLGRVTAELQHAFMVATARKSRAEPFIEYFFHEYCSHLADPQAAFDCITARSPFYMGLNHLRIARNDYITDVYAQRLVRQAKRLLAYGIVLPGLGIRTRSPRRCAAGAGRRGRCAGRTPRSCGCTPSAATGCGSRR